MTTLISKRLNRPSNRGRGFTLIELAITIGVMGVIGTLVVMSLFQTFRASDQTSGKVGVADQVARVSTWLTRDGHRATITSLVDGGPAVNTATFSWTESGALVSCQVALSGTNMTRTCGGSTGTIGSNISALSFSRVDRVVKVSYTVSDGGYSQSVALNVLIGGR
jgi:prepilin-type N-terminal cleavage/methylation domain-containing protein